MDNDNNLDEEENQLIIIDGEKWTVHMDEQTGKLCSNIINIAMFHLH